MNYEKYYISDTESGDNLGLNSTKKSLLNIFSCQQELLSISNDQKYMRTSRCGVGRRTTKSTLLLT